MSNVNYLIHFVILAILQIVIVDNIHIGSYFYINIYILAIFILPYKVKGIPLLLFGFLLGFLMDLALLVFTRRLPPFWPISAPGCYC